jgi:primosomal protein N'
MTDPMRCHQGHENPAGLWNCPECTDPILNAVRRGDYILKAEVREVLERARSALTSNMKCLSRSQFGDMQRNTARYTINKINAILLHGKDENAEAR